MRLKRLSVPVLFSALAVVLWQSLTGWNTFNSWFPNRAEKLPAIDEVNVTDTLLVAKSFRRSGLWIACSNETHIRLGLNTRLPNDLDYVSNGTKSHLRMDFIVHQEDAGFYDNISRSPPLTFEEAIWRRSDESDLLFTPALASEEFRALVSAFTPAVPKSVWVFAYETGTQMYGVVDGTAIADFATKCTGHTVNQS